jgi:hypothetical protein
LSEQVVFNQKQPVCFEAWQFVSDHQNLAVRLRHIK